MKGYIFPRLKDPGGNLCNLWNCPGVYKKMSDGNSANRRLHREALGGRQ